MIDTFPRPQYHLNYRSQPVPETIGAIMGPNAFGELFQAVSVEPRETGWAVGFRIIGAQK